LIKVSQPIFLSIAVILSNIPNVFKVFFINISSRDNHPLDKRSIPNFLFFILEDNTMVIVRRGRRMPLFSCAGRPPSPLENTRKSHDLVQERIEILEKLEILEILEVLERLKILEWVEVPLRVEVVKIEMSSRWLTQRL